MDRWVIFDHRLPPTATVSLSFRSGKTSTSSGNPAASIVGPFAEPSQQKKRHRPIWVGR
jgi:hypothetical protein